MRFNDPVDHAFCFDTLIDICEQTWLLWLHVTTCLFKFYLLVVSRLFEILLLSVFLGRDFFSMFSASLTAQPFCLFFFVII